MIPGDISFAERPLFWGLFVSRYRVIAMIIQIIISNLNIPILSSNTTLDLYRESVC